MNDTPGAAVSRAIRLALTAALCAAITTGPAAGAATKKGTRPAAKNATATKKPPVPVNTAAAGTVTNEASATAAPTPRPTRTLKIGAIPDVAPDRLVQINGTIATYLAKKLDVKVEYVAVTDYPAAVSLFRSGDLDLVWFGGLTGVQARLQTPGARVLAQRDIDDDFHSVFIVSAPVAARLPVIDRVEKLAFLKGLRFTYGSESSTSGRTMPEYFLDVAGIESDKDFAGPPGYSGSHDRTVDLVQAGTFEAGALNEQVWKTRKERGTVDLTKVVEVFRTPGYKDYHWIAGPNTDSRFGAGFTDKIKAALLGADGDSDGTRALGLLGAKRFIDADANNYKEIERIGRKLKLIS